MVFPMSVHSYKQLNYNSDESISIHGTLSVAAINKNKGIYYFRWVRRHFVCARAETEIGKMEMPTLKRCYNFIKDNIFAIAHAEKNRNERNKKKIQMYKESTTTENTNRQISNLNLF